jgi:Tfp pilus assembly protein PilV
MKHLIRLENAKAASRRMARGWIRPDDAIRPIPGEQGFSLLEAVIALLLMTIVALGSASLFSYSIYNNSGSSDRATSMAIAQEALELSRSAQFNSTGTDATLAGGTTSQTGIVRGRRSFNLTKTVDDDPSTPNLQVNAATNFKSITVTVVPQNTGRGWALGAGGTITLITQRSRTDR